MTYCREIFTKISQCYYYSAFTVMPEGEKYYLGVPVPASLSKIKLDWDNKVIIYIFKL